MALIRLSDGSEEDDKLVEEDAIVPGALEDLEELKDVEGNTVGGAVEVGVDFVEGLGDADGLIVVGDADREDEDGLGDDLDEYEDAEALDILVVELVATVREEVDMDVEVEGLVCVEVFFDEEDEGEEENEDGDEDDD